MFDINDKVLTVLGEAIIKGVEETVDDETTYVVDIVDGDRYRLNEDEILGSVHE